MILKPNPIMFTPFLIAPVLMAITAVGNVDCSAAETLRSVYASLKARGIRLVIAEVMDLETRTAYHFKELLGADAFYDHLEDVVKQYRQQFDLPLPAKQHA